MKVDIIQADITQLKVEAIVNAANNAMCGGGGVDGAIHRAAGEELLVECRTLKGCKTGEAKLTRGYNLPAQYIIHTVGPVWDGGNKNEKALLAFCYRNSLKIANGCKVESVAFPAISCGAYRFPVNQACEIAIDEIMKIEEKGSLQRIVFACFNSNIERALCKAYSKYQS